MHDRVASGEFTGQLCNICRISDATIQVEPTQARQSSKTPHDRTRHVHSSPQLNDAGANEAVGTENRDSH
jgi:hypothetical protein